MSLITIYIVAFAEENNMDYETYCRELTELKFKAKMINKQIQQLMLQASTSISEADELKERMAAFEAKMAKYARENKGVGSD